MSQNDLSTLRKDIQKINKELFELLSERQKTINKILTIKNNETKNLWDPQREKKLFFEFKKELRNLNVAAQFSLMMETQMSGNYPRWSAKEHLTESTGHLRDIINPILLFVVNKSEYQHLKLHAEIQSLIEEELNE